MWAGLWARGRVSCGAAARPSGVREWRARVWAGFCLRSRGAGRGARVIGWGWCARTWRVGGRRKPLWVVMRILLVSPPCLGIVYAVFKRGAACLCGEGQRLRK